LVALRSSHHLAGRDSIAWTDVAGESFGSPSASLFPEWSMAQQRLLEKAGISPPIVELESTDVGATGWTRQSEVKWVMTGAALAGPNEEVTLLPASPPGVFTYKLQWSSARTQTAAAARFVQLILTVDVPPGWITQPGHLRFDGATSTDTTEEP
jgi:hypothetical protein